MQERTKYTSLAAALVAAQSHAKGVEKDATNSLHKYKYASAEAIMAEAREALNAAGLACVMSSWDIEPPKGDTGLSHVRVVFTTFHADSDGTLVNSILYPIVPDKGRPEDKATATALTYAEGYYLRGLLCLPRVHESEDVDQRDDRDYEPRQPRREESPPVNRIEHWEAMIGKTAPAGCRGVAEGIKKDDSLDSEEKTRLYDMAMHKMVGKNGSRAPAPEPDDASTPEQKIKGIEEAVRLTSNPRTLANLEQNVKANWQTKGFDIEQRDNILAMIAARTEVLKAEKRDPAGVGA